MAQAVDITMTGADDLIRKFGNLEARLQKKVARQALRAAGKRIHDHVARNLSGGVVNILTGRLFNAWMAERVHAIKRTRGLIGVAIDLPSRDALGIDPQDKYYYPTALEYGTPRFSAKAPFRRAVDDHAAAELRIIGEQIGRGIENEARKA